jgi:hypothetical protein
LARRSRKRGRHETPAASAAGAAGEAARPPSRSELRDARIRAQLRPLADGERPGAVTVGAIVAAVLAVLVVVGYARGARIGGRGSLAGALLLAGVLLVAAWGMWNVRYWAVLGFEALLTFQLIVAALALLVASNLWAAALCLAVIGFGGWLFWKLIRAMARIQMPERRPVP